MAAEELAFRQHYTWNYGKSVEAGGAQELVCKRVCKARQEASLRAYKLVHDELEAAFSKWHGGEIMDELAARQVLTDLVKGLCGPTDAEMELLMSCFPTMPDEDLGELQVRLSVLATLWHLAEEHRADWQQRLQLPLRKAAVTTALRELNGGEAVRPSEVAWLQERFLSIRCDPGLEETKLLLCVAWWYLSPQARSAGLSRSLLLQRLNLEKQLGIGVRNFLLWGTVFTFFALALILSESLEDCRSIKGILDTKLQLAEAEEVTAPRDIHDFASHFSELLSRFAPLSSAYFLGGQAWTLLDKPKTFSGRERLPHLMEPEPNSEDVKPEAFFLGGAFTLQAWVHTVKGAAFRTEEGLSLLSKTHTAVGQPPTTCWSWRFPLQLRWGGHDYGPVGANGATGTYEERAKVENYHVQEEISGYALHTLRVNLSTATFMVGTQVVGSVALRRPVTDCQSEELFMGDKALTLASVRFYPRELSTAEVAQIFSTGLTWNEVARTSRPQRMKEVEVEEQGTAESNTLAAEVWQASTLLMASRTAAAAVDYNDGDHEVLPRSRDPVLGLPYWEIQEPSAYFGPSSKVVVPGISIPQRPDQRGFTLSAWVKTKQESGAYLLSLAMPVFSEADVQAGSTGNPLWLGAANLCWGARIGRLTSIAFFVKSRDTDKLLDFRFPDNAMDSAWRLRGAAMRHMVYSVDTANRSHPVRVCIDGKCAATTAVNDENGEAPAANCLQTSTAQAHPAAVREGMLNQTRLFLNHRPPDNSHLSAWQMKMKLFDTVLSDMEVERLFREERDPADQQQRPIRETQGCRAADEVTDDPSFRDALGQDCRWYLKASKTNEAICHEAARRACPLACASWDACWGSPTLSWSSGELWPRQLDFEPRGEHGTICVARSTTAEREAITCARSEGSRAFCLSKRAQAGGDMDCEPRDCSRFLDDPRFQNEEGRLALREELLGCLGEAQSVLNDVSGIPVGLPCKDIILLQRADCAWDDSALEALSGEIESTGEWSLSFWYQGLSDECPEPQIRLLDMEGQVFLRTGQKDLSPARFSQGSWRGATCSSGWGRIYLSTGDANGGCELPRPEQRSRKHFFEIGAKEAGKKLRARVNDKSNWETMVEPKNAKWRGLRVINVLGTVRLSALQLRTALPPDGQSLFRAYTEQAEQEARVGPTASLEAQASQKSLREYRGYRQKTILIAPPVVLLRRQEEGACSNPGLVSAIYEFGKEMHCQHPYECEDFDRSSIYKCKGEGEAEGKHFGERPLRVQGRHYYMEFLDTLTGNAVIVREEDGESANRSKARRTRDFVDLLTSEVQILALFHSVEFDIVTLLRITFDTSQGRVRVSSELRHSVSASDSVHRLCMVLYVVCLVCMVVLVTDAAREALQTFKVSKAEARRMAQTRCLDVLLALVACIVICLLMVRVSSSEREVNEALERVLGFNWDGGRAAGVKKEEFLRMVFDIDEGLFRGRDVIFKASTLLSLVLLMRVVYTTSRHPRMELITRTMELASEDLMHFIFLMGLVLLGFALLGTWMFGQTRKDFRNPLIACATLIDTVLGPPGSLPILDESYSDVDLLYAVVFHMICFFLLLNFVLAIIVDNYAQVQQEVKECTVVQALPQDVWSLIRFRWLRIRHRFPSRARIGAFVSSLKLQMVSVEDLCDGGLFSRPQAAEAFFNHYSSYDFLSSERAAEGEPGKDANVALLLKKVMEAVLDRQHAHPHPDILEMKQDLKEMLEKRRPPALLCDQQI